MKSMSPKKLSILGLVLMAASVVTAAIMPSKAKKDLKNKVPGHLIMSETVDGDAGNTCLNAGSGNVCDYTATGNGINLSSTSDTPANDDHSTSLNTGNDTGTETTVFDL